MSTAPAVVDGLKTKNNGSINNGPTLPYPKRKTHKNVTIATPVVIKQPAVHGWLCDSCGLVDQGGIAMLEHAEITRHRIYTPLKG